jgi:hypothetical protein
MLGKESKQPSFADLWAASRLSDRHFLMQIDAAIDWQPEAYVEMVLAGFAEKVGELVVSPLLARLEEVFQKQSYSAIESAYETEGDLIQAIAAQVHEHPIGVIKRVFGTLQGAEEERQPAVRDLCALANLFMARRHLLCPQEA